MKPLIIAFVVLFGTLVGVAWMNGRFGNSVTPKNNVAGEKSLYFEPEVVLEVGKEGEINLMGNYSGAPITAFNMEFVYDSTLVKVEGIAINDNFNKLISSNIDQNFGKVLIKASSGYATGTLKSGVQKLATIKMSGIKKGGMMITGGRRPEVTIFENGKNVEGDFTVKTFKVSVK